LHRLEDRPAFLMNGMNNPGLVSGFQFPVFSFRIM
jgi:hypothetical protein